MKHGRWNVYDGDSCYIDWCPNLRKKNGPSMSRYCGQHNALKMVWGEFEPIVRCESCGVLYTIVPSPKGRNRIPLCNKCFQEVWHIVPINPRGVTRVQWVIMYMDQDGKCYICKDQDCKLQVDHNHETGKIRKLLCNTCNRMVGYHESPNAVKYLNYLNEHAA